ncbi:MAG TPA: LamG domain-containing protein [Candidatus Limnocylindrales bacterium]|nr:LamG domain-containing protein [Candidatus Limnocylindrales bacterium]
MARLLMIGALACLLAACGGATGSSAPTVPVTASPAAVTSEPVATPGGQATTQPIASQAATCVARPSGLVAWWRAENDAKDALGAHDGALQAGAGFIDGKVGRAFSFDGATQYVSVPSAAALQRKTGITLEGWVYANGAPNGYAGIAGTWDDNTGSFRTYLFWVLNGTLEFIVSPDGGSYNRVDDVKPLPTGQWVHVAATYDGTTIRLYRDGAEVGSLAAAGGIAINDKPFLIGLTEGGSVGPNFWKGGIDELAIYDHALTGTDIVAIHAAGSAGKCGT